MCVYGNVEEYDFLCVGVFPSVSVKYICVCLCVCLWGARGEEKEEKEKFLFWVGSISKRLKL